MMHPSRWLLAGLLLVLIGCSDADKHAPAAARLIVIGFDGLDPVLTERWMDEGRLPNLAELRQTGHYQPLATTNPPQSPVAWASFATGNSAGHHGIFDFLQRDPQTYLPDFSIASYTPPRWHLPLGAWKLPLGPGQLENRRQGQPFWNQIEQMGQRATILRVPVTYPPDDVHRMLAGMGVPDLLGSQGTYTVYATRGMAADSGGRTVRVHMTEEGRIETSLAGPAHPLKPEASALQLPLNLNVEPESAEIELAGQTRTLTVGEWSDWWPVDFGFGLGSIRGMVRLHLNSGYPRPVLYVSPIHADPIDPVLPLTSPPAYAAKLAERIGRFHTLGMPEETWSLNQGHLDEEAFLDKVRTTLAEGEAMLFDALDRNDSELVVKVFVQPDRVSHMFWRGLDVEHPLHETSSALARDAIPWIYGEVDRIIGQVRSRMSDQDRLVIVSDHGFASFRRAVHLNRWLIDNGYLALREGASDSAPLFADIDWSRSQAYALGLNGVYVNQQGREGQGIVALDKTEALLQALKEELLLLVDDNQSVIQRVFRGSELYRGPESTQAPDLVIGYAPGYRASWQTSLGGAPQAMIEDNLQYWSGDHCIDPDAVPGVLFTSFEPRTGVANITAMAHFLLAHMEPEVTD